MYGGTYRLLARVMDEWGLEFDTVDMTDLVACRSVVREDTALVWVESPTNPFLKVIDIAAVADLAHEAGARCVVDNTFATPYLQRPLELGADVVLHSMTKYLGGHSDLIGGALVTSDDELIERLSFLVNAAGAVPGPMDCYLALRGVKTLALRMEAHCRGAKRDRRVPPGSPEGHARPLPRAARPSGVRGRGPADARLRRHGELRGRRPATRRSGWPSPRSCSSSPSRSAASNR